MNKHQKILDDLKKQLTEVVLVGGGEGNLSPRTAIVKSVIDVIVKLEQKYENYVDEQMDSSDVFNEYNLSRSLLNYHVRKGNLISRGKKNGRHVYVTEDVTAWAERYGYDKR